MTLEAFSGKNPISQIDKIYCLFASMLSQAICENGFAEEAEIFIVSQIGKPITNPQLLDIRLTNQLVEKSKIEALVQEKLSELPQLWKKISAPH